MAREAGLVREEVLIPLDEREDSGIDSDDAVGRPSQQDHHHVSSSQDDATGLVQEVLIPLDDSDDAVGRPSQQDRHHASSSQDDATGLVQEVLIPLDDSDDAVGRPSQQDRYHASSSQDDATGLVRKEVLMPLDEREDSSINSDDAVGRPSQQDHHHVSRSQGDGTGLVRKEVLIPLDFREDSNIDSDDAVGRRSQHDHNHSCEDSCSEDDSVDKVPIWITVKRGDGMEEEEPRFPNGPKCGQDFCKEPYYRTYMEISDRSSPPLLEIELTASDEDDDGSVLELVIPMQSSRYTRVPTSSPNHAMPTTTFLFNLFCCLRK